MADNSDFEQAEPANGHRAMEVFMDFQVRSVVEASNALVKSVPFYLAIVVVIIGYVLTQQLSTNTKLIFLSIGIVVSVSYCVAIALVGWGVIKGLDIIAQTMRAISQTAYEKANMLVFVRRGKLVTVACICVYTLC